ncbi:MAG: tyrosine-type recombinase/integrase [Nitrososphaerota archaeon]
MKSEIYDYDERLERYRRIIAGFGRNGEVALRFLDHLASLGLSTARLSKVASHIPALLRAIDFNLEDAARRDVERVVAWINKQPYREWTRHDKKLILRKLIQYAKVGRCDKDAPLPPEVGWIKLNVKERDSRVTPEALLEDKDIKAMIEAADNPRDRAMLHVLFEAALRPGELLSMRISSVEFKRDYCIITVNGKTGIKRIPLVASLMPLLEWVRAHPNRDDPNAPLWISLAQNYYGHPLSYRHFRLTIKKLAEKAGVKKDVWPYLFRHTTLTRMAKVLTEANLEKFAGWVHGSRMSARYVHFSARDIEDAVLAIYGIGKVEDSGVPVKIVKCPRCKGHNPEHHRFCSQCGLPLSLKDAYKAEMSAKEVVEAAERMEKLESIVAEQRAEIAELKALLKSVLSKEK